MKQLIIEKFENGYALCSEWTGKPVKKKSKDMHFFGIDKSELPDGAEVGTVLKVTDAGELKIVK